MKVIDNIRLYSPTQNFERNERYHVLIKNGQFTNIQKGRFGGGLKPL